MAADITHSGKIVEITPEYTTVEIVSQSACASCHASALCGLSEFKKKEVSVPSSPYTIYELGEEVEVVLKATMGHKAVWLAYVLPLVALLATLLILLEVAAVGELLSALGAIAVVGLYYFVIWLLRDKLKNEYVFDIRKKC